MKKTIELFYKDPNLYTANATLLEVKKVKNEISLILSQTLFYPDKGGQLPDKGFINDKEIIDVQEIDGVIEHFVDKEQYDFFKLLENKEVNIKVNETDRHDYSIQHTAQHLLSSILYDSFQTQTLSFRTGEKYATIDIESKNIAISDLKDVERIVNNAVFEDRSVNYYLFNKLEDIKFVLRKKPTVEKDIRIVEIKGYDASPCGGLHVTSTGQLGMVKIIKTEKYKGNFRIYFLAGKRALLDYQNKQKIVGDLNSFFSSDEKELLEKARNQRKQLKNLKFNYKLALENIITNIFDNLKQKNTDFETIIFDKDYQDFDFISAVVNIFKNNNYNVLKTIIIASKKENKIILFSIDEAINCGYIFKENLKQFDGRGGGNSDRAQGSFDKFDDLKGFIDEIYKIIQKK